MKTFKLHFETRTFEVEILKEFEWKGIKFVVHHPVDFVIDYKEDKTSFKCSEFTTGVGAGKYRYDTIECAMKNTIDDLENYGEKKIKRCLKLFEVINGLSGESHEKADKE